MNFAFLSRIHQSIKSNSIFLTYDDGPNPKITPQILEILAEYGAKGSFFVSGSSTCKKNAEEILRATINYGHTIGNHGFYHSRDLCPRFDKMHKIILQIGGVNTQLLRPPYGLRSLLSQYFSQNKLAISFHWSLSFNDWLPININDIKQKLPTLLVPGQIILLHDGISPDAHYRNRKNTVTLTKLICEYCKSKGIPLNGLSSMFPDYYQRI